MFKELKIVELASVLAGPSVGQFFAELGAEVIKVENPNTNGDVTRSWKVEGEEDSDVSAYFSCINWGKKSISLDITKPDGLDILYKLTADADIVLTSYKPRDAAKLGVDFNSLKEINSQLIYGEISGYGPQNPNVGYDAIIQAESGFMFMNGQTEGPPTKMPVALMDILAGHQLKESVLLAIIHRMRTGEGKYVTVSLIDAALASLVNQGANFLVAGKSPTRTGSIHPNIAPYGEVFETHDKKQLLLAIGNNKQFRLFCDVLGMSELPDDQRFITNAARVLNRSDLYQYIKDKISRLGSREIIGKLNALRIPAGIVASVEEAMHRPEVDKIMLKSSTLTGLRSFVGNGISSYSHITPPPALGEHNREVLESKLGLNESEIQFLTDSKIV